VNRFVNGSGACDVAEAMSIKEIQSKDWDAICERINNLRQQALLTVEVLHPDGRRDQVARDVPLQSMVFDRSDACYDHIALNLGPASQRPMTHLIVQPIHITLKPAENGSFNPMQIEAESGVTLLTFHPALRPDFLRGLQA
jgi:hypothetical protein